MNWLTNIFGTSDHLDRDPYRKLTVGLSHAWLGGWLIMAGLPIWVVVLGYIAKEVIFDLSRGTSRDLRIWADSATDLAFTVMGAAMVAAHDWRYGLGVLLSGLAYFVAVKVFK